MLLGRFKAIARASQPCLAAARSATHYCFNPSQEERAPGLQTRNTPHESSETFARRLLLHYYAYAIMLLRFDSPGVA